VEGLLRDLNHSYAEMAQGILTDFDTLNHHNTEICNILEILGRQAFYQVDKDWHYRKEERRWVPLNDQSSWYLCTLRGRKWQPARFFIR
jgi:hypothetical protein